MTGQGPLGPDSGDHLDQWIFPKVTLTKLEKRRILANVIRIAVLTMFNTHIYSFDSRYYLQQKGGPIGLRATCAVARLAMVDWDKQWQSRLADTNIEMEDASRYMDDVRAFLFAIREGWRWWEGELCWAEDWFDEDVETGQSDLDRTTTILQATMKSIYGFLNFTMEIETDFVDNRLPTLDFKLWVNEEGMVVGVHFL